MKLSDVDLTNADNFVNGPPHEMFEVLRKEAPVYWHMEEDGAGFWAITKYDDVIKVSKDCKLFSSEVGAVFLEEMTPVQMAARRSMLETDPPMHTLLRGIVSKEFTPRCVRDYEGFIREIAKELIEKAFAQDRFDFVHDIAGNLTMGVVARLLGIPRGDMEQLILWTNQMVGNSDEEYAIRLVDRGDDESLKQLPMRSEASLEVFAYANNLKEQKGKCPAKDLITKLIQSKVQGRSLTDQEYLMYFVLLLLAGNETNRSTMSHGVMTLKEHPEQFEMIRRDSGLLRGALEEILRYATPVYYFRRTATQDTQLRDKKVKQGDKVVVWYMSANYDEEVFHDPYTFNIQRRDNRHLVFGGGGPHFCLGAPLARLELKVLFEELIPHFDRLQILEPPQYMRSNHFNSLKHMYMSYK